MIEGSLIVRKTTCTRKGCSEITRTENESCDLCPSWKLRRAKGNTKRKKLSLREGIFRAICNDTGWTKNAERKRKKRVDQKRCSPVKFYDGEGGHDGSHHHQAFIFDSHTDTVVAEQVLPWLSCGNFRVMERPHFESGSVPSCVLKLFQMCALFWLYYIAKNRKTSPCSPYNDSNVP